MVAMLCTFAKKECVATSCCVLAAFHNLMSHLNYIQEMYDFDLCDTVLSWYA